MNDLKQLLDNNRAWSERIKANDPGFFETLAAQQTPHYLWIGCSDSRVPATQLIDLPPGELFVHRNVANVVVHTDFNCLTVLQFAVDILGVSHVIVCGHDGCGGVKAAMQNLQLGLADNWLRHVQDVMHNHETLLAGIEDENERVNRLCELNVIEQVRNLSKTSIIQNAMKTENPPQLHGLVYDLEEGLLRDLNWREDEYKRFEHIYGINSIPPVEAKAIPTSAPVTEENH